MINDEMLLKAHEDQLKFEKSRNTIKGKVSFLLQRFDECRNDDKFLLRRFFRPMIAQELSEEELKTFDKIFELLITYPSFETVRRVRQTIQNTDQMFLPTDPEVRKERRIRNYQWTIWCARAKEKGYNLKEVLEFIPEAQNDHRLVIGERVY